MRTRTRAKNEIHACLQRRLQERPPCSDLFGVKGRAWLAGLELPVEERESVDAGIRQIEFLEAEIAAVERLIAQQALSWPEIRRLMTVPGVNLVCAATFIAAVGDPRRFLTSRKRSRLHYDPRVMRRVAKCAHQVERSSWFLERTTARLGRSRLGRELWDSSVPPTRTYLDSMPGIDPAMEVLSPVADSQSLVTIMKRWHSWRVYWVRIQGPRVRAIWPVPRCRWSLAATGKLSRCDPVRTSFVLSAQLWPARCS